MKPKSHFFSLKKEGIDFSSSNDPTAKKRVATNLPKDPNVAASQQVGVVSQQEHLIYIN